MSYYSSADYPGIPVDSSGQDAGEYSIENEQASYSLEDFIRPGASQAPSPAPAPVPARAQPRKRRKAAVFAPEKPEESLSAADAEPGKEKEHVYSVTELCRNLDQQLSAFGHFRVEAEISGFKRYSSGHWYFTLKDENSCVSAAMFSFQARYCTFVPKDGDKVIADCTASVYAKSGRLTVKVSKMVPAGRGSVLQALEELKKKLTAEGLCSNERKKPLPLYPRAVGIITSPSGAAVHDLVKILRHRSPQTDVFIYPAKVEGDSAVESVLDALHTAERRNECDVLIIGRGGGSLESLYAFNSEEIARAVAVCPLPTISSVGHESDTTIIDLVSDQRASTPSNAAELAVRDNAELIDELLGELGVLHKCAEYILSEKQGQISALKASVEKHNPKRVIESEIMTIDALSGRVSAAMAGIMQRLTGRLSSIRTVIESKSPAREITRQGESLAALRQRLDTAEGNLIEAKGMSLSLQAGRIESLSPLAVLERGYSITRKAGKVVTSASSVKPGDLIETRLSEGVILSSVTGAPAEGKSAGKADAAGSASKGAARRRARKKPESSAQPDMPDLFS